MQPEACCPLTPAGAGPEPFPRAQELPRPNREVMTQADKLLVPAEIHWQGQKPHPRNAESCIFYLKHQNHCPPISCTQLLLRYHGFASGAFPLFKKDTIVKPNTCFFVFFHQNTILFRRIPLTCPSFALPREAAFAWQSLPPAV